MTGGHYAVFARTAQGERVRVSDPGTWDQAQGQWRKLDEQRHTGHFPHVRHFEVRDFVNDLDYAVAPLVLRYGEPVIPTRGFTRPDTAARRAWKLWQGEPRNGRTQGNGGWFYWHNGRTAAQGLAGLERLCRQRGLIEQGVNGRWYPLVSEL